MNTCIEHPLGILCRCKEYKEVVDKLKTFNPGCRNIYQPIFFTGN